MEAIIIIILTIALIYAYKLKSPTISITPQERRLTSKKRYRREHWDSSELREDVTHAIPFACPYCGDSLGWILDLQAARDIICEECADYYRREK